METFQTYLSSPEGGAYLDALPPAMQQAVQRLKGAGAPAPAPPPAATEPVGEAEGSVLRAAGLMVVPPAAVAGAVPKAVGAAPSLVPGAPGGPEQMAGDLANAAMRPACPGVAAAAAAAALSGDSEGDEVKEPAGKKGRSTAA